MESSNIKYIQGDLFTHSPPGSILLHACNAQGSWGAGVAAGFRARFPQAYHDHQAYCHQYAIDHNGKTRGLVGTCQLIPTVDGKMVACLFTSDKFGSSVDSPEMIVNATRAALTDLKKQLDSLKIYDDVIIHMPKINSGFFNVPWELTEQVLVESKIPCIVYSID